MGDWRKTQYKIGPTPDPLAESEDFKYIGVGLLVFGSFVLAVALLIGWLISL